MRGLNIKSVAIFFTFVLSILNTNSLYSATFCVGTAEDLSNALTTAATNNEDDTIKILQGIYYGSFFYDGHYENNTIEILGGYSNNCTERLNDYSKTILDSEGGGTVLRLLGNYYSTANFNFIVDGLTIQNGKNVERWSGGGIRISGRFPSTISNCKFFNNTSHGGGGILIASRELNIENCIFLNNTSHDGGGIAIPNAAYIDVKNCQFIENQAEDGGGIFLGENVYVVITACTFSNNISQYGGGVANWFGFPHIFSSTFFENFAMYGGAVSGDSANGNYINCIFANNTADYGGAMYNFSHAGPIYIPNIMNCTFWKNHANVYGGAILNVNVNPYAWPVPITNSIFWQNTALLGAQIHNMGTYPLLPEISGETPVPVVTYCNVQGGYPGEGNISTDPLLINPQNYDFHIKIDSPCINAGTPTDAPDNDFDWDIRPQGTSIDIGADEYTFNMPDILDFFDRSVLQGTLVGYGPGNSADGRLNSLRKMLERANEWIKQGEIEKACTQLKIAFERCDGVDQKSEFATGEATSHLNYIINEMMVSIGCQANQTVTPLYISKLLKTIPYHSTQPNDKILYTLP